MRAQTDPRLIEIAEALKSHFGDVSLRGRDAAEFVFVQANSRAVEVSIDDNSIWVEFWDSVDEEAPVPSVKEATLATVEEAKTEITNWLTAGQTGQV
jgi:hypothetical protein